MEHDIISTTLDRDERIDRYIKGQMDSQEETQFLADMASDDLLRQDAIAHARLVRGMQQVDDEFVNALKSVSESEVKASLRPRKILFRRPVTWLSLAASIAIILFAGYKGYDYYHITRLGMEYANVFPMESIVRGESETPVDEELQSLFDNVIERKDLTSTTKRLSELWTLANQDTYNDYTDYAPYIGWYLAIGYLENYEKDKAKSVLTTLQSTYNYSLIQNRINALINEI